MQVDELKTLCTTFGRVPEGGEYWEAVKYVHTPGQGSPAFDIEVLNRGEEKTCKFLDDTAIGPGFVIAVEHQDTEVSIPLKNDEPVVTFFDLEHIYDITLNIDQEINDIYDVLAKIGNTEHPVTVKFVRNYLFDTVKNAYIIERTNGGKIEIPFTMTLKLTQDEYDMRYFDKDGNVVDVITNPGEYILKIECKGKYTGSASCKMIIR